jgi:hypothetical protein
LKEQVHGAHDLLVAARASTVGWPVARQVIAADTCRVADSLEQAP